MSANRNQRLAWLMQQLDKGKSNAQLVLELMSTFKGVSEKTARNDLHELLDRLTEIELENAPQLKQRMVEIGFKLMEDARALGQLGPAVSQFKNLSALMGLLDPKSDTSGGTNGLATGTPDNQIVRERIAQLMKDKKLRLAAKEAGIALDDND